MQVLKKYLLFLCCLWMGGCQSSNQPRNLSVSDFNQEAYDALSLTENVSGIQDGNFRVGMLLPLTGQAATYGQGLKNAALLALDDVKTDNLVLQFYDTKSTPSGARIAAENAIAQNAQMIIGPLMSSSVQAIEDETTYREIPVVAFSTDASVLRPQVYTLGLLVQEQVNRIMAYAISRGKQKFALLLPDDETGMAIAKAAVRTSIKYNANITKIAFYTPGTTDFSASVKALVDYDKRSARLAKVRSSLQAMKGNASAQKALKRIERLQALGDVDFDAVIIPESGARLKSALAMFGYYDVYSPQVRFLGTSVWENTDLSRETMAYGSWYPALSRAHSAYFANKYTETFGEKPASIYSLSYDAVALASAIARKQNANIESMITSSDGYIGINGVFRIFANGTNEHSLEVLEVSNGGTKIVSEAPKRFDAPFYGVDPNSEIVLYDGYHAPEIYGKNQEAVQIAIYGRVLDYQYMPVEYSGKSEFEIVRDALKQHNVVLP